MMSSEEDKDKIHVQQKEKFNLSETPNKFCTYVGAVVVCFDTVIQI